MSIYSGLQTSTGVSALLNAPRETAPGRHEPPQETRPAEAGRPHGPAALGGTETARPVTAVQRPDLSGARKADHPQTSRYVRFMDAVRALRVDADAVPLDRRNAEKLRQAAEDIFMLGDGVPRSVKPLAADGGGPGQAGASRSAGGEAAPSASARPPG